MAGDGRTLQRRPLPGDAARYPECWHISVAELVTEGPSVAGRIAVDQDGQRFWCHGWWTIIDGRITEGVELWATQGADQPPSWRAAFTDD